MFKDLGTLFSNPLRSKVLTFFVRRPGSFASAQDVASVLGVTRETAHKEIQPLFRLGVLKSKKIKRVSVYAASDRYPHVTSLQRFIAETCIPSDVSLARLFRPFRGVTLVVASGLLSNEPKSPVDLLIVSKNPDVRAIEKAVKKAEHLSGIPLRFALLEAGEYIERRQSYDRMLRDVFDYAHRVVLQKNS